MMDSQKRKDVAGIENMAQLYHFLAGDLLEYLDDIWVMMSV